MREPITVLVKMSSELPEEIFKYLVSAAENLKYSINNFSSYSERDPNRPPPPKASGKLVFEYFGDRSPELLGFEDICPVREPCPDCASMGPLR